MWVMVVCGWDACAGGAVPSVLGELWAVLGDGSSQPRGLRVCVRLGACVHAWLMLCIAGWVQSGSPGCGFSRTGGSAGRQHITHRVCMQVA